MLVQWLGRVPYRWAWRLQVARRQAVVQGCAPDTLWLLEHDPVVTLGRRQGTFDAAALARRGVEVVQTERGGLATWHGPGQLVGYLMVDIGAHHVGSAAFVRAVEQGLVAWLARQGVSAFTDPSAHGVWVGQAKIAAIGLHIAHGVTMHGFALNLALGPEAFADIVPCGLHAEVTDLRACGVGVGCVAQVATGVGACVSSAVQELLRAGA